MDPRLVRRALHATHAACALVLLATGVLLAAPDLRARLVGGYGRELAAWHDAAAWLFLAAPAAALALAARPLARDARARLASPGLAWRRLHLGLALALSILLAASGVGLWAFAALPGPWYDAALAVHDAASIGLAAALAAHLAAVRRKLAARLRALLAGEQAAAPFEPDGG